MQALHSFSSALTSGQLGPLMHQFGLDDSAVAASQNGGLLFPLFVSQVGKLRLLLLLHLVVNLHSGLPSEENLREFVQWIFSRLESCYPPNSVITEVYTTNLNLTQWPRLSIWPPFSSTIALLIQTVFEAKCLASVL